MRYGQTLLPWRRGSVAKASGAWIRRPELILPHPRMQERGFVLRPLADVAPDWRHPLTGLDVRQMLEGLPPEALDGIVRIEEPD